MIRVGKKLLAALVLTAAFGMLFANGKKDVPAKKGSVKAFSYENNGVITKSASDGSDSTVISIIATSDMHGRIYPWEYSIDSSVNGAGFVQTDTVVRQIKEKYNNTLLIDIGDSVQGNSAELFIDNDIQPMIQAMNFLNYVLPYQIYEINGVRVAVIGSTAPHISTWEASAPEHFQNLDFTNPIDSLKETVKSIEGQYDVLVAAVHIGRDGEYEEAGKSGAFHIAKAIPELDIIFAGHEHATY